VNSSEELSTYIRDFVQQSTKLKMPEPKSRFIQSLEDDSFSSNSNDIGSGASAEESAEAALTASKLESISKKLVDYINRQEAQQAAKRIVSAPQYRSEEEQSPAVAIPVEESPVTSTGERTVAEKAASEGTSRQQPSQVVDVYINGQLQSSNAEDAAVEESDLTVSQLSSQYLGQAKKLFEHNSSTPYLFLQ
jgi:HD-GYP domain-containing protein (c-di-GMP phosphodiesterase class II)